MPALGCEDLIEWKSRLQIDDDKVLPRAVEFVIEAWPTQLEDPYQTSGGRGRFFNAGMTW